jgi:hypothetical protein
MVVCERLQQIQSDPQGLHGRGNELYVPSRAPAESHVKATLLVTSTARPCIAMVPEYMDDDALACRVWHWDCAVAGTALSDDFLCASYILITNRSWKTQVSNLCEVQSHRIQSKYRYLERLDKVRHSEEE